MSKSVPLALVDSLPRVRHVLGGVLVMGLAATSPAAATVVQATFNGTITDRPAGSNPLDPAIQVGSSFTVSYAIETDDVQAGVPFLGGGILYDIVPGAPLNLSVAGVSFSEQIGVVITDDPGGDRWTTTASSSDGLYINISFSDTTGTRLSSDAFFVNDSLQGWTHAKVQIDDDSGILAIGTILAPPPPTPVFGAPTAHVVPSSMGSSNPFDQIDSGDLDGDGRNDVAVAMPDGPYLLYGDGMGGFEAPVIAPGYPTSPLALLTAVRIVDLNRDGRSDLAAAGNQGAMLIGDGGRTFSSGPSVARSGLLSVPDLDGDGGADFANFAGQLALTLGDGCGGMSASTEFIDLFFRSMSHADFDEDGNTDIVAATDHGYGSLPGEVTVLFGDGAGGVARQDSFTIFRSPRQIVAGDFDEDGHEDLAVSHFCCGTVSVHLGDGSGGFAPEILVPAGGGSPTNLTTEDLNGDGHLDLAISATVLDQVYVLIGNGSGGFDTPRVLPSGTSPQALTAKDLDGDCRPELIVLNRTSPVSVQVFPNVGGTPSCVAPPPAHGDDDGDGEGNLCDNCLDIPNGRLLPGPSGQVQLDTDFDEIGNVCDCDFDNDGVCSIGDFNLFVADFQSTFDSGWGTDMNGSGLVGIEDFNLFLPGFQAGGPGPSGRVP